MLERNETDLWRLFCAHDPRAELSYPSGFSFLNNLLSRLDGPERPVYLSPWTWTWTTPSYNDVPLSLMSPGTSWSTSTVPPKSVI